MKLVIDIPEEDFERCKKKFQMRINIMGDAIANGKPLDISVEEATERFKKDLENGFYIDHATSPFMGTTTDIDYGG